jgi:hypothetical protein
MKRPRVAERFRVVYLDWSEMEGDDMVTRAVPGEFFESKRLKFNSTFDFVIVQIDLSLLNNVPRILEPTRKILQNPNPR